MLLLHKFRSCLTDQMIFISDLPNLMDQRCLKIENIVSGFPGTKGSWNEFDIKLSLLE